MLQKLSRFFVPKRLIVVLVLLPEGLRQRAGL